MNDQFYPVPLRQVRVAGAIGERVERTIDGNLLQLDWDGDIDGLSLRPFADPDGTATYFTPVDLADAVDDELLGVWT